MRAAQAGSGHVRLGGEPAKSSLLEFSPEVNASHSAGLRPFKACASWSCRELADADACCAALVLRGDWMHACALLS